MLIKLILEVRKAKIDWLRARLAINNVLLKVILGDSDRHSCMNSDDHSVIYQQNLSYVANIVAYE